MTDEPVVKVTLSTIYERVVGVEQQVARLSADLPVHVSITKDKQDEYEKRLENHGDRLAMLDTRVTLLEAGRKPPAPWYSIVAGVASIITGAGALIVLVGILAQLNQLQ